MFAVKEKYKKILTKKVRSLSVLYYGGRYVLYEPMVNFSANFCCLAADEIAAVF